MVDQESSIGGELTLGTETPNPDVIKGWNFKVEGTGAVDADGRPVPGAQALELDGLVPFVQLIGLYDKNEIDKLLGTNVTFTRTVEFVETADPSLAAGYDFLPLDQYQSSIEEQVINFEEKIRKNYIKVYLRNQNMEAGEAVAKDGIVLATNSAQAGNDAYEVINDIGTPKDAGGVGITDLQMETGTKEFLNRRYKLRMTITDPQVLDDKPEYLKLATLQSEFLIIYGWSNPDQLTAWPEEFEPAPVVKDVGATIDGVEFPNGRMEVDMSHNNTGGAWGAALVATTMYDFAFNEVGQLEANFTFMPREISFMHTIRVPVVAPIIQQILNSGQQSEAFSPRNPEPKPKGFAGLTLGIGNVANEFGKNLIQIISEEQAAYVQGQPALSSLFGEFTKDEPDDRSNFNLMERLTNWSQEEGEWSGVGGATNYYETQRREQAYARFPHAGVGVGTFTSESHELGTEGDENDPLKTYTHYTTRIEYYYLGWILEAMRFSLWDLNKGKASRGETPYDLKFRYMGVPRNSVLNYAVQDALTPSIIPSVNNYVAEATKELQIHCFPHKIDEHDPALAELGVMKWCYDNNDQALKWSQLADLNQFGYAELDPNLAGRGPDATTAFMQEWNVKSPAEKLDLIPDKDYRKSLISDRGILRILHPDFENQILYNMVPKFGYSGWSKQQNNDKYYRWLNPPNVIIEDPGPRGILPSDFLMKMLDFSYDNGAMGPGGEPVHNMRASRFAASYVGGPKAQTGRHGRRTPGQGFWRTKSEPIRFIGEGIFAYKPPSSDEASREWSPMIGQDPNWIKSAGNNKLNGEAARVNADTVTPLVTFGILMPARSARFYSTNRYRLLQQEYYNDHIQYLLVTFDEIVRKRIREVIGQGKGIDHIAAEPVDLFWLTGKKYTSSPVKLFHPINELPPLTLSADEQIELDRLEGVKTDLIAESEGNTNLLEYTSPAVPEVTLLLDTATTQFLEQPQNVTRKDAVDLQENQVADSILGVANKVGFWESRIKVILIELISKDLISTDHAVFPELADQTVTESSVYVAPPEIRQLTYQPESGERWIKNPVQTPPQPIPTDVFGGISLLKSYKLTIVNPNLIFNAGKIKNLMFSATQIGGERPAYWDDFLRYGAEVEINVLKRDLREEGWQDLYGTYTGDFDYIMPDNWKGLRLDGAARYASWPFTSSANYNIGLPMASDGPSSWTPIGAAANSDGSYSPNIIIDAIGAFSLSIIGARDPSRMSTWPPMQVARNNYIFMNWAPQSMRDTYAFPSEINPASADWTEANDQYDNYINNCRSLLKKYIREKDLLKSRITFLETQQVRIANSIATLQIDIDSLHALEGDITEPLSPFAPNTRSEADKIRLLGGGRKMRLNGARAELLAKRATKSLVKGAGDIQNYGPPRGGLDYFDKDASRYGWRWSTPDRGLLTPANLTYSRSPVQIAYLRAATIPHPGGRGQRSTAPKRAAYFESISAPRPTNPDGTINPFYVNPNSDANDLSVNIGWDLRSNAEQEALRGHQRTVKEFVEDNQLDESALKGMFLHKYDKELSILDPDSGPAALTTSGEWPTYTDFRGADTVRWALYIDDDLDFIVPKVHLTNVPNDANDNFLDTSPNNWVKIPWRFRPVIEKKIYPIATGARMAENQHLPNLTESAVQQLVRTEYNGFGASDGRQHRLEPMPAADGVLVEVTFPNLNATLGDVKMTESTDRFAGNLTRAYPGDGHAKVYQASTYDDYRSAGVSTANGNYPFGVPPELAPEWGDGQNASTESWSGDPLLPLPIDAGAIAEGSWQHQDPTVATSSHSVHRFLASLPAEFDYGFMSSVNGAGVDFEGGESLNIGVREWITNYFINLLPSGRRIGIADTEGLVGSTQHRVRDVTYGDLWENIAEGAQGGSIADFGNKTIENVAELPIKRSVVDNLLDPKNTNMSLMSFVQQLITPSSIGVNGNVQIAGRNKNGIMELAIANVDYRGISHDLIKNSEKAAYDDGGDSGTLNRLPTDHLLFDYKRRNSLIENIDMSSKMDPAAFLTYQNSSSMIHGPGRDFNILKLLSYEGIAEEFQEYLNGTPDVNNAGETYSGIVNIGLGNRVTIDRVRYSHISPTTLDGFVGQNPERWAKITAMMQGQNNFTTDLLAFYMRSVTLIIHGLTNIDPFNLINVKGVMPSLEGIYVVTNVTDRVTPGGFQTILEGKLIRSKEKVLREDENT